MRRTILVCLLAVGASAGDDEKLLHVAIEAKLKVGDLLREKGDLEGAMKAYREAVQLWDSRRNAVLVEEVKREPIEPGKPFTDGMPWIRKEGERDLRALRGGRKHRMGAKLDHAVELGLKWLADHQDVDRDGRWDCDEFAKHDPADDKCDGSGGARYDVGVTGLSLLAFLGAGYSDRGSARENKYAKNVRDGLRFLMTNQDDDGCFGSRASQHFMYNHALATLAMTEAYWMTRNPRYKKPAQDALNFIARARNPYLAWRYEPRGGENDTSVTGWMVMALKSGKFGGLDVDPDAFEGARQWIDKMTDREFGQVGYNMPGGSPARPEGLQDKFPPEKSQSMTAMGMLTRIFLGEDPRRSEMIRKGADLCLENPPNWNADDGSIDMYYWYCGTLAMFQMGGSPWKQWNKHMTGAIGKHQHPRGSGARTGSWDPIGPWGNDGGRVYSTATMVMCLEVYYRYGRVFGLGETSRSRWDPPTDIPHLASTDPELRRRIDGLVATMVDVEAGWDSLRARDELVALGKPAFPRILGAMAKIRDTITDVDSAKERMIESSLKLADECLREMDGWLTAKGKSKLRPGSEKRYIAYICRLHYKRWTQKLQHMDKMPGPFESGDD